MRDISKLQLDVSAAIRTLRTDYINQGLARAYFDINNGECEEFAEDVVSRVGAEKDVLYTLSGEELQGEDGRWDWKLLEGYWAIKPPEHFTWESLNAVGFGSHVWVMCGKRHYDSECLDGVDSFFDLPLFRRCIVTNLRRRGIDCPDVETEDAVPAPLCPIPRPAFYVPA